MENLLHTIPDRGRNRSPVNILTRLGSPVFIPAMRFPLHFILLAGLILGGCKSVQEQDQPAVTAEKTPSGAEASKPEEKPVVRPVDRIVGRVLAINNPLRFVIADFPTGRLPALDQNLSIYREDLKVAEVRVSGPYRGTTVAADITAGEVRAGDQVRANP